MKKLLLSSIVLVSLAVGPALAADLPRKAPAYTPPPPPPVLTWNGWYVGLNVGAGWNNNDFDNVGGVELLQRWRFRNWWMQHFASFL